MDAWAKKQFKSIDFAARTTTTKKILSCKAGATKTLKTIEFSRLAMKTTIASTGNENNGNMEILSTGNDNNENNKI